MKYRAPYHSYYVQLVFLSSLSNYIRGLFLMKYAYSTSSFPISHCMAKIVSLYHVCGDQWQAKHIAEPTMLLEGTLRSLWGQQLVIWLVICRRYMKYSQESRGWSVVYCRKFYGSLHGERCYKQDNLGTCKSCWKQADEIKTVVSVCAHTTEKPGRASRAHWELGSCIKMGKVDRVFRWCSHKFDFGDWLTYDWLGV